MLTVARDYIRLGGRSDLSNAEIAHLYCLMRRSDPHYADYFDGAITDDMVQVGAAEAELVLSAPPISRLELARHGARRMFVAMWNARPKRL